MYKFRIMYMDAEERKVELMKDKNWVMKRCSNWILIYELLEIRFFQMEHVRLVLGIISEEQALTNFRSFFYVLKGDMSIIGTRSPLISETNFYELHHRARLAIKPGITGMWQVSGRSDITDFEEVVRLDKEYITNWNIGLDIKILFKTILVVFKKDGLM